MKHQYKFKGLNPHQEEYAQMLVRRFQSLSVAVPTGMIQKEAEKVTDCKCQNCKSINSFRYNEKEGYVCQNCNWTKLFLTDN